MGYPAATVAEKTYVECQFPRLERLLAGRMLPTSDGGSREVPADEFMLMSSPGTADGAFKHGFTRRHVFVRSVGGRDTLVVKPGAYFDAYPEF